LAGEFAVNDTLVLTVDGLPMSEPI